MNAIQGKNATLFEVWALEDSIAKELDKCIDEKKKVP